MFLAIFVSLNGVYAHSLSVRKNATDLDSGEVIVKDMNYNAVNVYGDRDIKTALDKIRKKLESLKERLDALDKPSGMFVLCFDSVIEIQTTVAILTTQQLFINSHYIIDTDFNQ